MRTAVALKISLTAPMIFAGIIVEGVIIAVTNVAVAIPVAIGMLMLLRSSLAATLNDSTSANATMYLIMSDAL
jgi:hypothetical protein